METPPGDVLQDERLSSVALAIVVLLLLLALLASYVLRVRRIRSVHETLLSILIGALVGLVLRLSPGTDGLIHLLSFKHTLFFNLLLPPIILHSGYGLRQVHFFRNLPTILTFAFLGTLITTLALGALTFLFSRLTASALDPVDAFLFASTLSATDPVTILAIFAHLRVDPNLFAIVFGESLLNDAVAIVLYDTFARLRTLQQDESSPSLLHGVSLFLLSFSSSTILGILVGLATSLTLKHTALHRLPRTESAIVLLLAYLSYLLSNAFALSGIVSLLFTAITLKHYAYHTMSARTQRTTRAMFSVMAQLAENFIFVYLGLALFTMQGPSFNPAFIFVALVSTCVARYLAVFPLSSLLNIVLRRSRSRAAPPALSAAEPPALPHAHQMLIFWAGLRGAVGVALSSGFTGPAAGMLRTTVLVVVLVTVVFFGGTTTRMIQILRIQTGIEDPDVSDSEDEADDPSLDQGYIRGHRYSLAPRPRSSLSIAGAGAGRDHKSRLSRYSVDGFQPEHALPSASGEPSVSHSRPESGIITPATDIDQHYAQQPDTPSHAPESRPGMVFRDGKWFTALDERYFLPLFSNSMASRRHHAKKAQRAAEAEAEPGPDPSEDVLEDDLWASLQNDMVPNSATSATAAQSSLPPLADTPMPHGFKDTVSTLLNSYLDHPPTKSSAPNGSNDAQHTDSATLPS